MKTKRILSRLALLVVAMVLVLVACKKDPEEAPEEKLATVTTNEVENITKTAAACGGNVTDDGGANVTARGICWSTSKEPTTNDNATYNGSGTGSFTSNISGLTAGTTYYVRAYAVNNKGTAYGEERSFTTEKKLEKPIVTTKVVNNISQTGALCGGNVTSDGGATVTARGVCWSTSQNPTISSSKTTDGSGVGQYSSALNNLQPKTTYYVRAYATNSQGTSYGEQESFTTEVGVQTPTVTTSSVSNITANGAVCGGNVTSDGNATVMSRGVCWSTSQNPTISNNKTTDGSGTGSFTSNITGLSVGTTYYVRAYATNSKGVSYGNQQSFTTDAQQPTVTTSSVSNITRNSAVCGGNVTSDGGAIVTIRGVCWSTSQNPTISDNKTINGSGTGSFTSNITGLTGSTTYYVRAYATNSRGTAYGSQTSFTTEVEAQMPTVTTSYASNITANSAVCVGNVTSDGGAPVTARGVCWSTSQNPTISNNKTIDGCGIGSFASNITGLLENTTYYVRAYATNNQGTSYGNQQSFTTFRTITGSINGHNYVDLGLPSGLKWATCNVGSTTPEGYGGYYAWGETSTKTEYSQYNCVTYDQFMYDISGNPTYDAARANWGSTWRMPTNVEMEELLNNCTWTWTTQNGVNGYTVTGPNGNSLFLPAAGCYGGSSYGGGGTTGYYWSSTPWSTDVYRSSHYLYSSSGYLHMDTHYRLFGCTVRPVSE